MAEVVNSIFIKQDGKVWDLFDLPEGFVIKGDLDLSGKGLEKLPDLSKVTVKGNFNCSRNQLTSLEGAPEKVGGDFYCFLNQLTSLEGAPEKVGGNFNCSHNELTSLEGAPKEVGSDFDCYSNQLTSLKGAPKEVGGGFRSDVDIAEKYGLDYRFTLDELKASERYIKENKQEMIDEKVDDLLLLTW